VQDVAGGLAATAAGLERRPGGQAADVAALAAATRAPIVDCLQHHAHDDSRGVLKAGVDAAIVRDLLVDAAVLTDDALATVAELPD
jgi:hypothetical protein